MSQPVPHSPSGKRMSRRRFVQLGYAGAVAAVAGGVGVRELTRPNRIGPRSTLVAAAEEHRPTTGQVVRRDLTAAVRSVDLGGRTVTTWAYGDTVPAAPIRVRAGDRLEVTMHNRLPSPTTVHWHGIRLRNDMDGVPGVTMDPIRPGGRFHYSFIVPDPGTYWFHPHVGVQLDTGLQGPLIVEDPNEPGDYDTEEVLIVDDWTDGWGASPQQLLARFRRHGMGRMGGMGGMGGMGSMPGMGGMGGGKGEVDSEHPLGRDAGDVVYPAHLVNGRLARDPAVVTARPGDRVRLRLINAGSDTAYRLVVGGHRLTVTHADGYPVRPVTVDSLVLGMGERYDVIVRVGDGRFPIYAVPVGKGGEPALAVLRTTTGASAPGEFAAPPGITRGRLLTYADLAAASQARLPSRQPDRTLAVTLTMAHGGRRWLINGRPFEDFEPLQVNPGERVRLNLDNRSMMFHPMHLHGHTFALTRPGGDGPRKDTVNVLPMARQSLDLDTDNPGQWLLHCHNAYHGELGMMTVLSYVQ